MQSTQMDIVGVTSKSEIYFKKRTPVIRVYLSHLRLVASAGIVEKDAVVPQRNRIIWGQRQRDFVVLLRLPSAENQYSGVHIAN
jgi:hypothetical protein